VLELIIAAVYAQALNVFESLVWTGGLWRLKPPFPRAEEKVRNEGYHLALALAYVLPFIVLTWPNVLKALVPSILVWLLNDVTWHFWSVYPRYWISWIKFYFNPRDTGVVWYARFLVCMVGVTPRRMLIITLTRIAVLVVLAVAGLA